MRLKALFNRETVSYVIVGVLTTLVDYLVFALINELMKRSGFETAAAVTLATVISWVAAVIFAYILNKFIVFRSFGLGAGRLMREFSGFVAARVLSGVISLILMWVMTLHLGINEYIAKIATSVFNLVFNYVASKFYIFKK